ncbi:MAG TPA: VCBS repeat-containing protein, partial [Terriglobia bacterium]|nr:VCBS repeat-containing protein [Terriglobia bacterium]
MPTRLRRAISTNSLVAAYGALFLFSSPASAQYYLFNRADFPANATFGGMATADFNGDGTLDLAVVGSGPSGTLPPTQLVTVLMGKPDGTFAAPVEYQTGGECGPITVGDFNGDGKPDLALPCYLGAVSILLGNGDGTFQAPRLTALAAFPASLTTGDFNRDGKLDVAVINGNQISVLLGNGDGTFQPPVECPVESAANAFVNGLISGDFNGDGKLDLAVTHVNCPFGGPCVNNFVGILLGNGDGTFQPKVDYATAAGPQSLAAGDFNHDGNLDLAVVTTGCNKCGIQMVSILLGKGDGTFGAHVEYQIPDQPYAVTLADLNEDGKLDLAVGGIDRFNNPTAGILLGNGDGTFQALVDYSGGVWAVGDFNRDGKVDLAFATNSPGLSAVSILLGN